MASRHSSETAEAGQQCTKRDTFVKCSASSRRAACALLDGCHAEQVASSSIIAGMGLWMAWVLICAAAHLSDHPLLLSRQALAASTFLDCCRLRI